MEQTLSCPALGSLLAQRADVALIDVRRRAAFDADPRTVPGAVWRDPEQVTNWADGLNLERPIVVYCVHGHEVSHGAVDRLRALGFQAALLEGGIEAWKASGRPVTDSNGGIRS
jgi:rhodanese-related sulfurtransferase